MKLTNEHNIPLPLQVWLVNDSYDYINDPNYVSATQLLKPIRSLVLGERLTADDTVSVDLSDLAARALGNSFHDSVEKAWSPERYKENLRKLGYSEEIVNSIVVNPPDDEPIPSGVSPVYIEQRGFIELDGFRIGGKFDMVADSIVHDLKSTSTYAWTHNVNDDAYKLQGSLYRLIHPTKITEDFIRVLFLFTDFTKARLGQDNYPSSRIAHRDIPLMSIEETKEWVLDRLSLIKQNRLLPSDQLVECTDQELWLPDPVYKFYANSDKTDGRATRNFNTKAEADAELMKRGKGIVISELGSPKRCGFCDAYSICTQKDRYFT